MPTANDGSARQSTSAPAAPIIPPDERDASDTFPREALLGVAESIRRAIAGGYLEGAAWRAVDLAGDGATLVPESRACPGRDFPTGRGFMVCASDQEDVA